MRRARIVTAAALSTALPFAGACGRAASEEPPAPVTVTVSTVGRADVADLLSVRGRLVSPVDEDATLAPQVAGRIVGLPVREGDVVRRGALVAEVDRRPLEEEAAAARAVLAKAREDETLRERASKLTESLLLKGIASAEERDADRASLEAARAVRVEAQGRLARAERELGWAELHAPFDGVVAKVLRHPGEIVDGTASTPVVRLLGTSSAEVAADATADALARIAPGEAARVSLPGTAAPVDGRVVRVARSVDPATGVGEIRIRLASRPAAPLLSTVEVALLVDVHRSVVAVPQGALRRSPDGSEEVVVAEKGAARVVPVAIGLRSPELAEIRSGLSGGEQVVVDTPLGLESGQPLAIRAAGTVR